ncbi:hypothetical protein SEUCBS139899_000932 [Sporothrix eucalyptigena]|uniref:CWH43-like N-terminal domain-containing protein n=1 Tax=Sporothrix eucalyptigena TaxID=1812306 RepID=A0ABP0BJJ0_9PEZI
MPYRLSYFFLPILSGSVWLGMLLGMLIGWVVDTHREHYVSMDADQQVAYISDIGASPKFKPMFIALCVVTTVTLDLSFLADRWLRHAGRLTPNGSRGQKVLASLTIIFAIFGTAGLILLSIFDVAHHKNLHDGFLLLFLGGYVLSAICICWEYQRLGKHNRNMRVLRISFWIKLFFVLVEIVLAIIFVSLTFTNHTNGGAVVEWIIAFIFALYVYSFAIDLYPAVHTRHLKQRFGEKADGMSNSTRGEHLEDGMTASHAATMAQDDPVAARELKTANVGGYRGYGVNSTGATPANGNVPSSYYDTTYGESAARATRSPRTNKTANGSAFVEDSLRANGGDTLPLNEPQQAYQPSRTYQ